MMKNLSKLAKPWNLTSQELTRMVCWLSNDIVFWFRLVNIFPRKSRRVHEAAIKWVPNRQAAFGQHDGQRPWNIHTRRRWCKCYVCLKVMPRVVNIIYLPGSNQVPFPVGTLWPQSQTDDEASRRSISIQESSRVWHSRQAVSLNVLYFKTKLLHASSCKESVAHISI